MLRHADDIFRQRPELGSLPAVARDLRDKVDAMRSVSLGASSLTTAELRLLPLLPTHLSFREIGERLYVSRHTIKTQAISIYRKLGVASRSQTIERMRELGLLELDVGDCWRHGRGSRPAGPTWHDGAGGQPTRGIAAPARPGPPAPRA